MKALIIAIDGYSSTGKSTLAKSLAKKIGYRYIDTGAMYRVVALYAIQSGFVLKGEICKEQLVKNLHEIDISFKVNEIGDSVVCLNNEPVESLIRGMEVSKYVSKVSAIAEVRELLVAQQQKMGEQKGVVMDGRDIGSIVFPNAELKIFMKASEDVRATRRLNELRGKGSDVSFEEVKSNIAERDYLDTNREIAPLIQVADAIVLDNSDLTEDEQLEWMLEKVKELV